MSVLAMDRFGDGAEALYGIFDGDRNEEVPRLLQCTMGDVLAEELQHSSVDNVYMCNTFLTSHRYSYKGKIIFKKKMFLFIRDHLWNNFGIPFCNYFHLW